MAPLLLTPEETWPLRREVLRNGDPDASLEWPGDREPGSFHLGWEREGLVLAISTWHREDLPHQVGMGYRLRGMAVSPVEQGGGLGGKVLREGIERARGRGADYLWCNARVRAVSLYVRAGFAVISPEFEIPGVGPHFLMMVR